MNKDLVKLLVLVVSFLFAMFIIQHYFSDKTRFENLALNEETKEYLPIKDNFPIHILKLENFNKFHKGIINRNLNERILFLGNSQTHSINQLKPGDKNYVEYAFDSLSKMGTDAVCVSMPNINLQETYLAYKFLSDTIGFQQIYIPVFYDDLREDGIRDDGSFNHLKEIGYSIKLQDAFSNKINKILDGLKQTSTLNQGSGNNQDIKALNETTQEVVEEYFNNQLIEHTEVWDNRAEIRGRLFFELYKLRNSLFNINAQTKRKKIKSRYDANILALINILEDGQRKNLKIILYIPPIRKDVEFPYVKEEYNNFKKEIKSLAKKYNKVYYEDLDSLVAGKYWGFKSSTTFNGKAEYDFMHFQNQGHRILSDTLIGIYHKIKNDI